MLVVAKLSPGRSGYYLEHLSPSDAAAGFAERPGRFTGRLAAELGVLDAPVEPAALDRLLHGRHPRSGELLRKAVGRSAVAAFDLTFTAPKSVSLLHALGADPVGEAVGAAHVAAVEAALSYLADHGAAVRRRTPAGVVQEPTTGLVAAMFVHRTSRANEPHLHTHAVVANLARAPGGDLRALDARPLYLHLRTAGALYDAALRAGLADGLGLSFRPGAATFEVAGLPDRVLEAFSTRRRQILDELEATGYRGPRAAAVAAARTRPAKDRARSYPELVDRWRADALRVGCSIGRFQAVLGPPGASVPSRWPPAHVRAADAVATARDGFEGPFTRRELLAAAAGTSRAGLEAAVLEDATDAVLAGTAPADRLGERPALLGGSPRPLPAGRAEVVYRSARLRGLEAALASYLGELPGPEGVDGGAAPWRPEVLRLVPGRHLESLAALSDRARAAGDEGMAVRAHAPTGREAAAFAALTGIPTTAGDQAPLPSPTAVVVAVAADRLPVAFLERLVAVGRARSAPLLLVLAPGGGGVSATTARSLLEARARPLTVARWRPSDLAATSGRSTGPAPAGPAPAGLVPGGPAHPVATASRLEEAVAVALDELCRRRQAGERAVLVTPDRPSAEAIARLAAGGAERSGPAAPVDDGPVVHLAGLAARLEAGGVDGLVVLGAPPPAALGRLALQVTVAPLGPLVRPFAERSLRLAHRLADLADLRLERLGERRDGPTARRTERDRLQERDRGSGLSR